MPKLSLAFFAVLLAMTAAAEAQTLRDDGSIEIGGQRMRCAGVPVALDVNIPTEGMFAPGDGIILNPDLMQDQPAIVRKFVFAHECAHKTAGADELGADCAAAKQGARERWLTQEGVASVCRDFDQHVADADHPAGSIRCANVKKCFAEAQPAKPAAVRTAASAWPAKRQAFRNEVSMGEKLRRAAGSWRAGFGDAPGG